MCQNSKHWYLKVLFIRMVFPTGGGDYKYLNYGIAARNIITGNVHCGSLRCVLYH